ncbi:hypothetical protein BP00DRAFT_96530 [Aspergillus indologenus CBS 114.80]|uniref:CHCH domain-containing protein n=1 Tax=Aspergillus indologenus CBS 114.80 TaxID=1450541 RepID=A0A2V5J7G5_9EURO|nr:hypothetical protein BP00DRAFT_96530 [Aspergillus indologenus CBS 114.80]
MTNKEERPNPPVENAAEDDDEPDEWEKRINRTGCADEQMTLNDCVYQKKDWRSCQKEPSANAGNSRATTSARRRRMLRTRVTWPATIPSVYSTDFQLK